MARTRTGRLVGRKTNPCCKGAPSIIRLFLLSVVALFVLACEEEPEQPAPATTTVSEATTTRTPLKDYRTPTPVRASTGLRVSLNDIQDHYAGLAFEYHQLSDGRDRWMATGDDILVEVIGPKSSPQEASVFVSLDSPLFVAMIVADFLELMAPDWEGGMDWVDKHAIEALSRDITTQHSNYTFTMGVTPGLGLLSLEASAN